MLDGRLPTTTTKEYFQSNPVTNPSVYPSPWYGSTPNYRKEVNGFRKDRKLIMDHRKQKFYPGVRKWRWKNAANYYLKLVQAILNMYAGLNYISCYCGEQFKKYKYMLMVGSIFVYFYCFFENKKIMMILFTFSSLFSQEQLQW